jgi:uncharacterized membrane protein
MKNSPPMRGFFRVGSMPTARVENFSDAVFAIVVTLLVLEIHVPQFPDLHGEVLSAALRSSVLALTPKFLSYVLSFFIVCVWWVAHHHLFHLLRKSDRGLLWLNNMFLMWLVFIPFPTALLGDYPHERIAIMAYGSVNMMAGVFFSSMRYYAFYVGGLTVEGLDPGALRRAMIKSILNPVLLGVAVAMALLDPAISIALYVILPLLNFIPTRLDRTAIKGK